ncbi:pilus assembly protein TadG-related protein [soil metagenome]
MAVKQSNKYRSRKKLGKLLTRFRSDCRGTVALIAGISAIPLMLAAGVAVDMARASHEAQSFQAAIDASALAVAASDKSNLSGVSAADLPARRAELKALAQKYITKNYTPKFGDTNTMTVDVQVADDGAVTVQGYHSFPTAIMRIVGIDTLNIGAHAEVKKAAGVSEGIEVILVMDTTGSMSGSKITAAKDAAKSLIAEVLGSKTSDANIKFALVPFAAGVQVGTQYRNNGWIDVNGASSVSRLNFTDQTWHNMKAWDAFANVDWNGCVESRPGNLGINDTPPVAGDTLFPVYFAPDESDNGNFPNDFLSDGTNSNDNLTRQKYQNKYNNASISNSNKNNGYWPGFNCATAPIIPLTNSRAIVEAGINAMSASGSTVIPEGLAWGWRVGSSGVPFTEGSVDNDPFWRKIIVLMTDGENNVLTTDRNGNEAEVNSTNGSFYSSYGYVKQTLATNRFGTTTTLQADTALNTKTATLCNNIKAARKTNPKDKSTTIPVYEIYTVVFDLSSSTVENMLKTCATDAEHYANASSNDQLKEIFATIGERLKTMYLSK